MQEVLSSTSTSGSRPALRAHRTVYVLDDDDHVRRSLSGLLRSIELEVREFETANAFLDSSKSAGPSCLLLDVRLRGESGLTLLQSLGDRGMADLPVIMMTGHGDVSMSVRAMKSGARDFIEKPFRDQDMIDSVIDALQSDERRLSVERALDQKRSCWAALTPREREVLHHVAEGRLNKQIAGELGTAEITVKIHRGQGMRKMQSRSVAELVRKMQSIGVLDAN